VSEFIKRIEAIDESEFWCLSGMVNKRDMPELTPVRMKKGDIVYIPDSSDTSVYVMGSVPKPGAYRLTPRMTVLDALAQSGGPNEDAAPDKIGIYRAGAGEEQEPAADARIGVEIGRAARCCTQRQGVNDQEGFHPGLDHKQPGNLSQHCSPFLLTHSSATVVPVALLRGFARLTKGQV
jgi:hypothetical protein